MSWQQGQAFVVNSQKKEKEIEVVCDCGLVLLKFFPLSPDLAQSRCELDF